MSSGKIEFVRASDIRDERLNSFVLEVNIDNHQIADVLCLDRNWYVTLVTADGEPQRIEWKDFLTVVYRMSEFVAQENEIMLREAGRRPHTE